MRLQLYMTAVFLAAASSWFFLQALIPQLRLRLLDQPNARSCHSQPTPRGGGLAFVVVAMVSSGLFFLTGQSSTAAALPLVVSPLSFVGLLDDRHNLSASSRYGAQLLTAIPIMAFSPLVQRFGHDFPHGYFLFLPFVVLLVAAITAVINFSNFMDGLDGLLTGCMVLAIPVLVITVGAPWPLWGLVGALLGFLPWNWCPSKVFMGDVGSTFLGAVFAGLVLQAPSWQQALGCLLVLTPLLGDACLCLLRRLLAGHRVLQPHRLHLFQRLHQAGWTHSRVSLIYIAATAVLALAMLGGGWLWVFCLAVVELLVGFWLDQCVAVPFAIASQS
jgi:Fuc2NAc and GlcNAc transferase